MEMPDQKKSVKVLTNLDTNLFYKVVPEYSKLFAMAFFAGKFDPWAQQADRKLHVKVPEGLKEKIQKTLPESPYYYLIPDYLTNKLNKKEKGMVDAALGLFSSVWTQIEQETISKEKSSLEKIMKLDPDFKRLLTEIESYTKLRMGDTTIIPVEYYIGGMSVGNKYIFLTTRYKKDVYLALFIHEFTHYFDPLKRHPTMVKKLNSIHSLMKWAKGWPVNTPAEIFDVSFGRAVTARIAERTIEGNVGHIGSKEHLLTPFIYEALLNDYERNFYKNMVEFGLYLGKRLCETGKIGETKVC